MKAKMPPAFNVYDNGTSSVHEVGKESSGSRDTLKTGHRTGSYDTGAIKDERFRLISNGQRHQTVD
jgi:hypothetical protein